MSASSESDYSSYPNVRLIEQALRTLKQSVTSHIEHESRLERLCQSWQESWSSQCEQLRLRLETLEARFAPWMTEQASAPRLAVVSHQEDAA